MLSLFSFFIYYCFCFLLRVCLMLDRFQWGDREGTLCDGPIINVKRMLSLPLFPVWSLSFQFHIHIFK